VKRAMQQQKAGNRTMRTRRPTVRREARRP